MSANKFKVGDKAKIETIEINGKNYNKADVEEAIKDLEVVD